MDKKKKKKKSDCTDDDLGLFNDKGRNYDGLEDSDFDLGLD